MKKSLSIFLVIAMILSMCTVVGAADTITVDALTHVGGNSRDAATYTDLYLTSGVAGYAEYDVNVSEAGMYQLSVSQKFAPYQDDKGERILNVYVDDVFAGSKTYDASLTQEWNWTNYDICEIPLNEGTNRIKLEIPYAGLLSLKEFTLVRTGDLSEAPVVVAPITVDGPDYVGGTAGATDIDGTLKLYGTQNAEYNIEAPVTGKYKLNITFRNMPYNSQETVDPLDVYVGDYKVATAEIPHESYNEWNMSSMDAAVIILYKGVNKLKFEVSAGNILYIDTFTLTKTDGEPDMPIVVPPMTVDGPDYVGGTAGATDIDGTLKLYGTQNAEYNIEAPVTGKYKLNITFRNMPYNSQETVDPLNVYVGDYKVATAEIPHESYNEWNMSSMDAAVIILYKGVNKLKFEVSAGNILYIDKFTLERTGDLSETPDTPDMPVVVPPITVDATDYVAGNHRAGDESYGIGTYIDLFSSDSGAGYIEYEVEAVASGMYQLSISQRYAPYQDDKGERILNVYVDDVLADSKIYDAGLGQEWNWTEHDICEIPLNEGTNRIKLEIPLAGEVWIQELYLERTGDLPEAPATPAMVITADGADITESKQLADAFSGAVEVKYTPVDANPYFIIVAYYEDSRMISCAIATENDGVHTATLSGVTKGVNNKVKIFLWDTETTLIPYGPATEIR